MKSINSVYHWFDSVGIRTLDLRMGSQRSIDWATASDRNIVVFSEPMIGKPMSCVENLTMYKLCLFHVIVRLMTEYLPRQDNIDQVRGTTTGG